MSKLTFTALPTHEIAVLADNGARLGELVQDVDGFYYFWPSVIRTGCWPEWCLAQTAEKMRELNEATHDHLSKA